MKKYIGLLGRKGSGKDTAADALEVAGYYRTSFAKALKKEVCEAFGVSPNLLEERGLKDMPVIGLQLSACRDPEFYTLALAWCNKAWADRGVGGFMRNPTSQDYLLSPRRVMQLWGTEYRRAKNDHYWIDKVDEELLMAEQAYGDGFKFVITDVRENHEVAHIRSWEGEVVKIVRPDNPYSSLSDHSSETSVDECEYDILVKNDSTIEALQKAVLEAVK